MHSYYRAVFPVSGSGGCITCIIILFIVVQSFIEVSEFLLSQAGVKVLFSEKFSQDPLERFFGMQRSHGGRCDNPTVRDFVYNTTSLRLQGSLAKGPTRGNCCRRSSSDEQGDIIDDTPLPKRKCIRRKL